MTNMHIIDVTDDTHAKKEILRLYNDMPYLPPLDTVQALDDMLVGESVWAITQEKRATDQLVGFVAFEQQQGGIFVHVLMVDEPYRNHGFGRRLLDKIKQTFASETILLLTSIQNDEAQRFYEREGFIIHSEIQAQYNKCYLYRYN